jgi:hypothetical protein
LGINWLKPFRLTFNREGDIPFVGGRSADSASLDLALHWTMIDHLDAADLGESDTVIVGDGETRLRESEGVIAVLASKTRIARLLSFSNTPKEGFHRQVNTNGDVLKHLGMNSFEGGTLFFEDRKGVDLPIAGQTFPTLLIGRLAHLKQVIVEPTTLFKGFVELLHLFLGGVDPIRKVFMHTGILAQKWQEVKREAAPPLPHKRNGSSIPMSKARGFTSRFDKWNRKMVIYRVGM